MASSAPMQVTASDNSKRSQGSTVVFSNLSYEVNDKKEGVKRLVDNVSVELSAGQVCVKRCGSNRISLLQMLAILGPS